MFGLCTLNTYRKEDTSHRGFLHGDFRLGNLLFTTVEGKPELAVIDWEDYRVGRGVFDVAWLLGGGLDVSHRCKELGLLRHYHRTLMAYGVDGYPFGLCLRDYRVAMLSAFAQGVLMATSLDRRTVRGQTLARKVAQRFIAAAAELCLEELVAA